MKRSLVISMILALAGSMGRPCLGQTRPAGNQALTLDEVFELLDKDHDGRISKAEATGPYAQRFAQWDVDGTGYATREQVRAFRAKAGIDDNGRRIGAATRRAVAQAVILKGPAVGSFCASQAW